MKSLKQFLVDYMMDVMRKNEGKDIILKNGSTYTCIDKNRRSRYAVGKGKEGKFIPIKNLYDYLREKKIQAYCVVEDDSISLLSDDIKTLNYTKIPTEKDYDKYVEDEKKLIESELIESDMETWTKLLNDRINNGESITGYTLKDSTCGRRKEVVLDMVNNEGEFTLYIGVKNEEHLKMILDLVTPLITEKTENKEDNTNDGKNDYLNTMVEYAKSLEVKHYQRLRRHAMYSDIFEYASKNKLSNNDIELMLYMRQDFDTEEGLPNFPFEFTNDSGTEDVLNSVKEHLYKNYDTQKITLLVYKNYFQNSFELYVKKEVAKVNIKEIKIGLENKKFKVRFRHNGNIVLLNSIEEIVRFIVKEFDLSPVCINDDKNDGEKDIPMLMNSLMSKLKRSGNLKCFVDDDTLTGIIQWCANVRTYIKYSKNDDCFYIDRDDKTVDLNLIQLIKNKLKHYKIDFKVVKHNGVKHFKIDLNEGNLSIL